MKNLKFVSVALILGTLISLVACTQEGYRSEVQTTGTAVALTERVSGLQWNYTNGPVSPDYQYSVSYQLDLNLRTLHISVYKGALVTENLPPQTAQYLTPAQVDDIRGLISQLTTTSCGSVAGPVGGGVDYLSLYTTSLSYSNVDIYHSDCTGYDDGKSLQGNAYGGYNSLVGYLQSL